MKMSVAPGTLTALNGVEDTRAYYLFDGDLSQMGTIEERLRAAGFEVVKSNVYPGFARHHLEEYKRALAYVYQYRIEGWWNQKEALIRHGVCTIEEYTAALNALA